MSKKTLLNETQIRRFMKLADLGATEKFQSLSEMGGMGAAYDRDEDMGDMDDMGGPPEDEGADPVGDMGGDMSLPPEAVEAVEQAVEAAVDAMGQELEKFGVSVDASREGDMPEPPGGDDELMEDRTDNLGHGPGKEVKDGNGKPTGRYLKEEEDEELEEAARVVRGRQAQKDREEKEKREREAKGKKGFMQEGDEEELEELAKATPGSTHRDRLEKRKEDARKRKEQQSEGLDEIDYIDDEAVVEEVARRVAARLMRESRAQKRERQIEELAEKIANKLNQ